MAAAAVIDDVRGDDIRFCSYHRFIIYGRAPLICRWLNLAYVRMTYEKCSKIDGCLSVVPECASAPRHLRRRLPDLHDPTIKLISGNGTFPMQF